MKQLTLRGFGPDLERKIRELARREGLSLNQAALHLMRRGAGLHNKEPASDVVGSSLDFLIGKWTDKEAEQVLRAIEDFERIDEQLWR